MRRAMTQYNKPEAPMYHKEDILAQCGLESSKAFQCEIESTKSSPLQGAHKNLQTYTPN
jgi:hypothetical protein